LCIWIASAGRELPAQGFHKDDEPDKEITPIGHHIIILLVQGCHFGLSTQNVILLKLQQKLLSTGLLESGVTISASDETSIDVQCQSMYNYSEAALSCISQVNTHCVSPICHPTPINPAWTC
jgi:hypothetical protein